MLLTKGRRRKRRPVVVALAVTWAILLAAAMLGLGGGSGAGAQTSCATPVPPGSIPPPESDVLLCYPPGWNLVGGPATFPVPLWLWDPGASQYNELPAGSHLPSGPADETDGQGAWGFFQQTTAVNFGVPPPGALPVPVPLTSGKWQQVGSPLSGSNTALCGSGFSAFMYDAIAGTYSQTAVLTPGQGAWVYAPSGGALTLKATDVPPPPSPCS